MVIREGVGRYWSNRWLGVVQVSVGWHNPLFGFWGSWPGWDRETSNNPQLEEKRWWMECKERREGNGNEKGEKNWEIERRENCRNQIVWCCKGEKSFISSLCFFCHFVLFSSCEKCGQLRHTQQTISKGSFIPKSAWAHTCTAHFNIFSMYCNCTVTQWVFPPWVLLFFF